MLPELSSVGFGPGKAGSKNGIGQSRQKVDTTDRTKASSQSWAQPSRSFATCHKYKKRYLVWHLFVDTTLRAGGWGSSSNRRTGETVCPTNRSIPNRTARESNRHGAVHWNLTEWNPEFPVTFCVRRWPCRLEWLPASEQKHLGFKHDRPMFVPPVSRDSACLACAPLRLPRQATGYNFLTGQGAEHGGLCGELLPCESASKHRSEQHGDNP